MLWGAWLGGPHFKFVGIGGCAVWNVLEFDLGEILILDIFLLFDLWDMWWVYPCENLYGQKKISLHISCSFRCRFFMK